jgi:hypothetical protein
MDDAPIPELLTGIESKYGRGAPAVPLQEQFGAPAEAAPKSLAPIAI